ncbi:MAG: hypothetical protein ACUVQY_01200 [Thermoproteota archaeon]
MSVVKVKEVNSLNRVYEEILRSVDMGKNIRAGGALVTFQDKEQNFCELSATYMVKPGRFSKEQRVVVSLPLTRGSDGIYIGNVEESIFHVVQEEKGGLKEVWSGKLREAMDKLGEIAKLHVDVVSRISSKLSS